MAPLSYSSHSHCFDRSELAEFALGKLPASELERIAVEVETCPNCQALLETLDGLEDSVIVDLKGHAGPLPLDPQLNEQIQAAEEISRVVWGGSRASVPEERLPAHLGQYEIRERIGRGGMGTVYKAMHTRLKRPVAIKVLPAGRLRDPQAVARFQREMEAVGQLDHPNLVCAHDAGEAGGQHFLAMEFLDGIDLAHMVRQRGPLAVAVTCEVARQAALGLQYAHEHGLVHRDVKPSNIMLTATGIVKVLDLGLARVTADVTPIDDMTATGQIVGTGDFIAPEQGQDTRQADARSDIYSLGCTLYFLLAGQAPFCGPEHSTFIKKVMAHTNKAVPPIQRLRTDIPDSVAAVLDRMLAKEPGKRYQTAADVARALASYTPGHVLQDVLEGHGTVQARHAVPGAKQHRRRLWLAVALPLALILAVVGFLYGSTALLMLRGEGLLVVAGQRDDVELVVAPAGGAEVKLDLDDAGTIRLRAGEYDIRVAGGKTRVVIEPARVTIVRGGRTIVGVQRQPGPGITVRSETSVEASAGRPDSSPTPITKVDEQDRANLLGTWTVVQTGEQESHEWMFRDDGNMVSPVSGAVVGTWRIEPATVRITWPSFIPTTNERCWETLNRPIQPQGVRGDSWTGPGRVRAVKKDSPTPVTIKPSPAGANSAAPLKTHPSAENNNRTTAETPILGAPVGTKFADHTPREGLLVGLKMSTGKFGNDFQASAVSSLQGVYRTKDGIVLGKTNGPKGIAPAEFVAKEGYAVGGLEIHAEAGRIMGVRIVFMQVEGDRLNREVSYLSPPYLSVPDGSPVIGGDGKLVVGIKGSWAKQEMRCIGLIQVMPLIPPTDVSSVTAQAASPVPEKQITVDLGGGVKLDLVLIPAGEFIMGSSDSDHDAMSDEKPQHKIIISKPFYLGQCLVTVGEFGKFATATGYKSEAERDRAGGWQASGATSKGRYSSETTWRNPGYSQTDEHPVTVVTWNDAMAFCKWLSDTEHEDYRLPTEAEWEYACRAGTTAIRHIGDAPRGSGARRRTTLDQFAWYLLNSEMRTWPVGRKRANPWELYDMYGNAREWCMDWYGPAYYKDSPLKDPAGPASGDQRCIRGSCFMDLPPFIRSAKRLLRPPGERFNVQSFRVVRTVAPNPARKSNM